MEMSYNIPAEIKVFTGLPLEGMGMDVGKGRKKACPRPLLPPTCAVPKKKRRANTKASRAALQKYPTVQNLAPPQLSGYGDTIILKNPFDDSPPTTSRGTIMNVGTSAGQYVQPYRMDVPMVRSMSPMMPAMNVMGPAMSHNIGNIRPTVNHMNHVGGYVLMMNNQAAPSTSFMSPINNMGQKLPNESMIINNPIKMGQMAPPGNLTNKMSAINRTINGPFMSINNTNCQVRPVRPLNLPMKNVNEQQSQTCKPFNFNHMSNDFESVEQLINMDIIQENEIESMSCLMAPSNKHAPPSMGPPMNLNDPIRHLDVQRTLEMEPNQNSNEKIYPVDQPMIFDFQNLHAPPIYPCGICHKEVKDNDQGIVCESGCNFWFHRGCLGLTEAAFQMLTQEIYAEWVCDNCLRTKDIPMVKFKP